MNADIEKLETRDAWEIQKDSMQRKQCYPKKKENSFFQSQMDESNPLEAIRQRPIQGESHLDFIGESEGSLPPPHDSLPDAGEAINDFGPCQEASYTAITLNPESSFTRREKNHSLFHWNTLTSPQLHVRIWMSSKRSVSMMFEYQWVKRFVWSLDRFHSIHFIGRKISRRRYAVRSEINKKTADIQARSFMVRTLERNVKNR